MYLLQISADYESVQNYIHVHPRIKTPARDALPDVHAISRIQSLMWGWSVSPGKAMLKSTRLPDVTSICLKQHKPIIFSVWLSLPCSASCEFTLQFQCLYVSKSSLRLLICCGTPAGPQPCHLQNWNHPQRHEFGLNQKEKSQQRLSVQHEATTSYKYHLIHFIHSVLAFAKSAAPWSPEPWPEIYSFKKCIKMLRDGEVDMIQAETSSPCKLFQTCQRIKSAKATEHQRMAWPGPVWKRETMRSPRWTWQSNARQCFQGAVFESWFSGSLMLANVSHRFMRFLSILFQTWTRNHLLKLCSLFLKQTSFCLHYECSFF